MRSRRALGTDSNLPADRNGPGTTHRGAKGGGRPSISARLSSASSIPPGGMLYIFLFFILFIQSSFALSSSAPHKSRGGGLASYFNRIYPPLSGEPYRQPLPSTHPPTRVCAIYLGYHALRIQAFGGERGRSVLAAGADANARGLASPAALPQRRQRLLADPGAACREGCRYCQKP